MKGTWTTRYENHTHDTLRRASQRLLPNIIEPSSIESNHQRRARQEMQTQFICILCRRKTAKTESAHRVCTGVYCTIYAQK